jgi:hypothetical protein
LKIVANSGGSGGGGGGGRAAVVSKASISFSGYAYPDSIVAVLKDGQKAIATKAEADASFEVTLRNLTPGSYNFSLHCEDHKAKKSSSFSFSINLAAGTVTEVGDIFMSPTIGIEKDTIQQGEIVLVSGQTMPSATVMLRLDSVEDPSWSEQAGEDGVYAYTLDTSSLRPGMHVLDSKAVIDAQTSLGSQEISFRVVRGSGDGSTEKGSSPDSSDDGQRNGSIGDLNDDSQVNLVDFSILAYWLDRSGFSEEYDLNSDGRIDLIDFSILAYSWTG